MLFLTTTYFAPIEYYRLLNSFSQIVIEKWDNYIKQTYRNRCIISGANGLQTLSIPVVKPATIKCFTKDIQIADHGNWRHHHWYAIVSAYNSTPFFEYYADDFYPFFEKKRKYLFDFNEHLRELICKLLDISPDIIYSQEYTTDLTANDIDLRDRIHPKKDSFLTDFKPYFQVFEKKYGFQPNLSIIDLLFNMGPESLLYILPD